MGKFTLCWDCAKATNDGCMWSRELIPVDGWEAVETKNGYIVNKCPEFERDAYCFGQYRTQEEYLEFLKRRRIRNEQADDNRERN